MRREILIVDDQKGVRRLLEELFRKNNWIVHTAADGSEAMTRLASISPHIILMDMKMPGMNGLETSRKILAQRPEMVIVMMTAYGEMDVIESILDAGVKKCVTKPFDIMSLYWVIREMVNGGNT